jgi:hypothetical protein
MLVSRIIGDCPACDSQNAFGNVSVGKDSILRGCKQCKHSTQVWLPEIRKNVIYLDQFFYSSAFRENDKRFVEMASKIDHVCGLQLLVAPFSSVHEDETHQWRGYNGKSSDELLEFIKRTSRGNEFEPSYEIEQSQVLKAFGAYLKNEPSEFVIDRNDGHRQDLDSWDDYTWIDVGRYIEDIELRRTAKVSTVDQLIQTIPEWRASNASFEDDVALEISDAAKIYIKSYFEYAERLAKGDVKAFFDSNIRATIIESMLYYFEESTPIEEKLNSVVNFFNSHHFKEIPQLWISARVFGVLREMIRNGAYADEAKARKRLGGFFQDLEHFSNYAPYCDAMILDRPMGALVSDARLDLENRYGVKIYSLNNWDKLSDWLDNHEKEMTKAHRVALQEIYP